MIGEKMYMIPSDMNLRIGKIKNYNNKIPESKSYFKLGINKKINLNEEKGRPAVKPEGEGIVKTKPDVKQRKRNLTSSPIKPGFHYTANATTTTQKQSNYKVDQSSFTLIALF